MWTLTPPPNRKMAVIETLVCFATIVSTEGASTVAALSLHGLLPDSFPRHAWNLAVGTWFRLGGTQKTRMAHKLYCIPAGQQTMPLPQSVSASLLVGYTSEGKEDVELTNTHLCLWLAASTLFLSRFEERIARSKCDLSLPMGWTTLTNPVTCCGPTEELMDNSCL